MRYLDIVDQFKTIEDVYVGVHHAEEKFYVRVRGTDDNGFHDSYTSYNYKKVAQEVAKRISYFIGV